MIDVRILGPLEVERDGELLELGGRKQRSVLAVFALHARQVISTDRLGDAVWSGEPPASADTTLRGYVSNLRKVIESDTDEPRVLRTTQNGYLLYLADEQIDASRFEQLVEAGRAASDAGDVSGAVEAWTRALALWRGEALQDFAYDEFARSEAARLTELRLTCTEDLFEARIDCGEHSAVVGDLEAFCAANPGRERALASRMLALYRCGRQEDALTAYETGRRRLADELGIDPSPELRTLHERIIRQDGSLTQGPESETPTGKRTLTFLLGGIEHSTEKLRTLGDEYVQVLAEHRRLLGDAFGEHRGWAVRTRGDGVFAAFDVATDAVNAAVATQIALGRAGSDEEHTLSVRMGLHTGEARFKDGDFVGLAVHLAARIMDAAHGGQVLVSQATKDLVEAEEGNEAGFLDAGRHTLKDFPDSVRLLQVVHPELRLDFPPLRTRTDRIDNLPSRLKSIVGREQDLEEIEQTLVDGRIVTLTGVGGVGKTTLALEAGRALASRYEDGAWFCGLASIGEEDALVHSLAATLGVDAQPGRSMRESLLATMGQRECLLILDNCEHLLSGVADLARDIVHQTSAVDVLATSREALDIDGERSWLVRSLEASTDEPNVVADAVRLFEDRARGCRPEFAVDATNASDVTKICSKLDGIPLGIELAAARVTSLSVSQIVKQLDEGFHFLRSGRRLAPDRQRTLRATIDWSYDLLTESEKLLFDRLSVFAGGFALEAAEEVCGHGLAFDVVDGLASLVAKSMIDADVGGEEARYSFLETMRKYARDRLADRGEADDTLRAHAVYFVRLVERAAFNVGGNERVLLRIVEEFDNLRAVQAWAHGAGEVAVAVPIAVGTGYLATLMLLPEGYRWAEETLAMPGAEDHELLPVLLAVAASGARRRGDPLHARELVLRALEVVDDPDDERRLLALNWRVLVSLLEGKPDEARQWKTEYLRVARVNDDLAHQIAAHGVGASVESMTGAHDAAIEEAEAGYDLARNGGSLLRGYALVTLGQALGASGHEVERALDHLDQGIELCRASKMHYWEGLAFVSVASLRAVHGDPHEALVLFGSLIDRWRRAGDRTRQWLTIRHLAELLGRLGLDEPAAVLLAASGTSASVVPSVGVQGERLEALQRRLSGRMAGDDFAAAADRGRAMADEDAVAFAKTEIARALELQGTSA